MKQYAGQLREFVTTDTARLMATYLCIIMIMSICFSLVLYQTSTGQLERQRLPPGEAPFGQLSTNPPADIRTFIANRIEEGKRELASNLIIINLLVLLSGSAFSYFLARRTLEPMEAAMEAQTQFVSDASHELRTPLTALKTTNEVALRRKQLSLKEAKETLSENIAEVDRLQQLTDGLLRLLARDTVVTHHSVDLHDVLNIALTIVMPKALDKRIGVQDETPPFMLQADANSLVQILTILLDNAIKYSPPNTTITVRAEQDTKHTYIHIVDQGIGIPETDINHVFSRFYRGDSSRSATPGYGLGLPIAHKIVKLHSGTLSVESTLGKGSVFTVAFPAQQ
ncbi:MAG: Two-component sensor histidine kinase [Candidatus Saccharibacteria bacterium GW2011_GWC2_48_9]|nr:MAG: Two-component sensor histidine kinase [Candidatus Saccharibacteria bacterium GW2011_GWC2_48_9]HCH34345.1 hypothetical protein [Candidatus Saccharibacteria bacterium]